MLWQVDFHKGTQLQLIKYDCDRPQAVVYLTDPAFIMTWYALPKYVRRALTEQALVYQLTAPRPLPLYIGD